MNDAQQPKTSPWLGSKMECPACGVTMKPVMRYTPHKVRWYQLSGAGLFCSHCNARLVLVWTKTFKTLYTIAVVLELVGIPMTLSLLLPEPHYVFISGVGAMLAGAAVFMAATVSRRFSAEKQEAIGN